MKTPIIVGNWKMNLSVAESAKLATGLMASIIESMGLVVVCPSFTSLVPVSMVLKNSSYIKLGAQDGYFEDTGAYTGEVSYKTLAEIGCEYVIVGHSERRQNFGETNEIVNKKFKAILRNNLVPILCVGETKDERESEQGEKVVQGQLESALEGVQNGTSFIVAYEPIWAINNSDSARAATGEEAMSVLPLIRKIIDSRGDNANIIYGGSVDETNVAKFVAPHGFDGVLPGTASIQISKFINIITNARNAL